MKILSSLAAILTFTASTSALANAETDSFKSYFEERFVGQSSKADVTWDETSCVFANPVTGKCVERAGEKIYGKGSGTVSGVQSYEGRGVRFLMVGDWDDQKKVALMDIRYIFNYAGKTSAKKQCYPGNVFCGMEWGELHPKGKVFLEMKAGPGESFYTVRVWYSVTQGHNDRPNEVVKKAMQKLSGTARDLIQRWLHNNGVIVNVELQ